MNFVWNMTEKDWKNMKEAQKKENAIDFFGNCYIGGVCFYFQHTLDESDWYAYINCFYVRENSNYGCLDDGTRYDLHGGSPAIPLKCRTFDSFKKRCEKLLEEYINKYDELKVLVNTSIEWHCCE